MSKDKARIGHVNSDHLWYGFDYGKSAALKDHKESGTNDSTIVAVVRLSDYAALEAKLAECVAALEFYACKANWGLSEITLDQDRKPFWYLRTEIKNDCEEFEDKDARGGKRAREVLAKVKK